MQALLCRHGSVLIAVPIGYVVEVMRPLAVEPLREMPPFVQGVSVVRGSPLPVIDADALLGGPRIEVARWVHLRVGARSVVLGVHAVEGFVELAAERTAQLPALLREANPEVLAAIGSLDADLLIVLGATKILSDAEWQAVDLQNVGTPA